MNNYSNANRPTTTTDGNMNANSGANFSPDATTWKSVFISFEKAKSPTAVIQDLSAGNFFVSLRPGTMTTEHCRVIEVMVPSATSCQAIYTKLSASFADVAEVTSACATYQVAVSSLCFKQVNEALRGTALKVGGIDFIQNGQAYFTIVTDLATTPTNIATAFDEAQIEVTCLTPIHTTTSEGTTHCNTFNTPAIFPTATPNANINPMSTGWPTPPNFHTGNWNPAPTTNYWSPNSYPENPTFWNSAPANWNNAPTIWNNPNPFATPVNTVFNGYGMAAVPMTPNFTGQTYANGSQATNFAGNTGAIANPTPTTYAKKTTANFVTAPAACAQLTTV